jgi:hypothetical protein
MNDKVTPKLSKSEKQRVKQAVRNFAIQELGFVLSFPEYGATVAIAPAVYAHETSPVPWSKSKFMRFSIAWLGEGDIFRRRTGQDAALELFDYQRIQTVPTDKLKRDYAWLDYDTRHDDIEIMLRCYFESEVLPAFTAD